MIVTPIPRGFFILYIHSLKPLNWLHDTVYKLTALQASKQVLAVLYAIDDSGMENMQGRIMSLEYMYM